MSPIVQRSVPYILSPSSQLQDLSQTYKSSLGFISQNSFDVIYSLPCQKAGDFSLLHTLSYRKLEGIDIELQSLIELIPGKYYVSG